MMARHLPPCTDFPNTKHSRFLITSQQTNNYNCIAWAYGINDRRMWPGHKYYAWPKDVLNERSKRAFVDLFSKIGYQVCNDGTLETGFIKIALFEKNGEITHAAKQLINGLWSSKLGDEHDVSHTLESMADGMYGNVAVYMKKNF